MKPSTQMSASKSLTATYLFDAIQPKSKVPVCVLI